MALSALLEERNVTRSGRRAGLSQPAMSAALARLRHHFYDDLLAHVGGHYDVCGGSSIRRPRPGSSR
ncbi:LysR family transcriptional regulator [Streptomyces akebiae]|uniref:LysR family transcriptional regulator n=1 Tax=Streptomyces akebiae TaxID=2865673 RepID=A0ABX8XHU8_9ACTN|nr:LysR family transcriptional regulator [Streptomyces akebiae]